MGRCSSALFRPSQYSKVAALVLCSVRRNTPRHMVSIISDRDESEDEYGSNDEVKITDSNLENLLHSDEDSDEEEERRSRCDGSDDRDDDNGFKRKK
ncbi:hypothetical protein ACOSQ3_020346 [Xanthoceras sorbifolium]